MQVIDAEAAEFGFPLRAIDPTLATEADEAATRFRFDAANNTRAGHTLLGRILEMKHDAVVALREHLQGRDGAGVVQIAQDDNGRPASQRRGEFARPGRQ